MNYDPSMNREEKAAFVASINLSQSDEEGNFPLHLAACWGDAVLVELMIEAGADVEAVSRDGATPLTLASMRKNSLKIIKVLLDAGAEVNHCDEGKAAPLHWATLNGGEESVQQLIAAGANTEARDSQGRSVEDYAALGATAAKEAAELAEATPTYDASMTRKEKAAFVATLDLSQPDEDGDYPLHNAVFLKDPVLVELMVKAGADVEAINRQGVTPLILACHTEKPYQVIKVLLSAGADVNRAHSNGMWPLQYAAVSGNKKSVQQLIAAGADIEVRDAQGNTVKDYALRGGNYSIVELLQNSRLFGEITADE